MWPGNQLGVSGPSQGLLLVTLIGISTTSVKSSSEPSETKFPVDQRVNWASMGIESLDLSNDFLSGCPKISYKCQCQSF